MPMPSGQPLEAAPAIKIIARPHARENGFARAMRSHYGRSPSAEFAVFYMRRDESLHSFDRNGKTVRVFFFSSDAAAFRAALSSFEKLLGWDQNGSLLMG